MRRHPENAHLQERGCGALWNVTHNHSNLEIAFFCWFVTFTVVSLGATQGELKARKLHVGISIFPDVEVLDLSKSFLNLAVRSASRRTEDSALFRVFAMAVPYEY